MSIFNEFLKEKPVFTGLKFGFGSGPSGPGVAPFSASGGDSELLTMDTKSISSHKMVLFGC